MTKRTAKRTDCPFMATFKEGDTTFLSEPPNDDIAAVKSVVAP